MKGPAAAGPHLPSLKRLPDYPVNSPHAAARLVGAALLANGRIETAELAALNALNASEMLGLDPRQWDHVIHRLRADLIGAHRPGEPAIRGALLQRLLNEVAEPRMRRVVACLCEAVVHADRLVEGSEISLLDHATKLGCRDRDTRRVDGARSPEARATSATAGQPRTLALDHVIP